MKVANVLSLASMLLVGGAARAQQQAPEPTLVPQPTNVQPNAGTKPGAVKYYISGPGGAVEERIVGPSPPTAWSEYLQPYSVAPTRNGWTVYGFPPSDEGIGAQLVQADNSLRAPLGLPNDRGLVVTNVVPNGPAAMVGLQNNDILLTLFDKPLDKPEDFLAALNVSMAGTPAPHAAKLTLLRAGKPMTISVRAVSKVGLAPLPAEPPTEYFIGVSTSPADETLRSHLTLPAGTGVVVLQVVADSPAAKAGMIAGDVLLSYEGKPLPSGDVLRELIQANGTKQATLTLLRKGAETKLAVTPERRKPEPSAAVGNSSEQEYLSQLQNALTSINYTTLDLTGNLPTRMVLVDSQQADLSKKIDDLNAQIQALSKAVEELRKEKK